MVNNMRWVEHFSAKLPSRLSEQINDWCAKNNATPVSISVYKAGNDWFLADVIVEGG